MFELIILNLTNAYKLKISKLHKIYLSKSMKYSLIVFLYFTLSSLSYQLIAQEAKNTVAQNKQINELLGICEEGQQKARVTIQESEEFRKVARFTEDGLKKVLVRETTLKKIDSTFGQLMIVLKKPNSKVTRATLNAVRKTKKALEIAIKK